ncbi:DNA-directed DNA polymerase [Tanacetum coccineum]
MFLIIVIMEFLVNINKRHAFWSLNEDILKITILKTNRPYPSRKIRRIRACTHQRPQRNNAQYAISREDQYTVLEIWNEYNILEDIKRGTESKLRPYHFIYPERSLKMKEMLNKSNDEGKREHEEMRAFIYDFQTTNKLLFKERNNSLFELKFGVQELLKVINNVPMIDCNVKGVTTKGGKTMTQDVHDDNTNVLPKEPLVVEIKNPVGSKEVLTNDQPQMTSETVVQPSNEVQTPPVPFPRRLRKEKEEAQQKKFLENLKQLHINLPLIEALAQMPKYAKFLKDMPEDSRVPIVLGRPFLATARAMIDVFNKKITLRVGDDEVIFDVDQSIKRPTTEDDECYGINDMDDTINEEARELLANDEPDSFLSRGLEKSFDQSDLECCESANSNKNDGSDSENSIRQYAYLHGDKSFPIIIASELSKKEKISLLQVLEKQKGAIAWKMSDIKGISPSYCTHKILMENDYKAVIQPQRRLNPKVHDVVKTKIVKLLDSGLMYPILDSSWVSPIHVVPKKGGVTIGFFQILIALEDQEKTTFTCNFMEVFIDDFLVFENRTQKRGLLGGFYFSKDLTLRLRIKKGAENLAADHLSRLENRDLGTFTEEEITDEFLDEPLMILKAELNNDEPWYVDYVNYIVGKIVPQNWTTEKRRRFFSQVKNYFRDEPYAFKLCSNNVMRRCLAGSEILEILAHCYSGPTGGHYSTSITGREVYESGFYWPSIFKDAKDYVIRCDACQRSENISLRSEMP